MRYTRRKGSALVRSFESFVTCIACRRRRSEYDDDDLEGRGLPTTSYDGEGKEPMSPSRVRISDVTAVMPEPSVPSSPIAPPTPMNSPTTDKESSAVIINPFAPTPPPTVGKQLWKNAVRNVKMRNAMQGGSGDSAPPVSPSGMMAVVERGRTEPIRKRTTSSGLYSSAGVGLTDRKKTSLAGGPEPIAFIRSRVSTLMPKLDELEATHDLAAHCALVRHMQFSPDGKYLATSR